MSHSPYRPTVGITTQTLHSIDGIPPALPQSWVMNQRYFLAATMVGAVPWMIPLLDDDLTTLRLIYERVDALLIPGGVDMDPATYGEPLRPETGNLDPARDRVELQLARWAIEDGKPLLGLCRGAQIINVAQGGSLYQDLATADPRFIKHDYFPPMGYSRTHLAHHVDVVPGTRLEALLDHQRRVPVNSMHHQGFKTIGDGLVVSAWAPDGLAEAVEGTGDAFLVGVQWHPEVFEMTDPHTRHLFGGFIAAGAAWAERRGSARLALQSTPDA